MFPWLYLLDEWNFLHKIFVDNAHSTYSKYKIKKKFKNHEKPNQTLGEDQHRDWQSTLNFI